MRRIICLLALAVFLVGSVAFADDDDGIMGIWQGAFQTEGWQNYTLSAQVIAQGTQNGADRWRVILLIGDWKKPDAKAEIEAARVDKNAKTVPFGGEVDLGKKFGGSYRVSGEIENGAMTGKMKSKGKTVAFTMKRVEIKSPTLGEAPPAGAVVLMDGTNLDAWERVPLKWNLLADGATEVTPSNFRTIEEYGSGKWHVEFRTPFMPSERGQGRGNSGVYIFGRYEVQVLDSFGLAPADNLCGGIYKEAVPLVNACLPPLTWQTYDITFTPAKFDASGKKTADARITVVQNGVLIHDDIALSHPTPGGISGDDSAQGPLLLQDHHNSVRYRNIWFVPAAE